MDATSSSMGQIYNSWSVADMVNLWNMNLLSWWCDSVVQHLLSMCEAPGSVSMEEHISIILGLRGLRQGIALSVKPIWGIEWGSVSPLWHPPHTHKRGRELCLLTDWFPYYIDSQVHFSFFPLSPVSHWPHTLCDGSKLWRWTSPTWLNATAN